MNKHQLGDRVVVDGQVGLIRAMGKSVAQVLFDDDSIGTYPLSLIKIRNDLYRVKPGQYASTIQPSSEGLECPECGSKRVKWIESHKLLLCFNCDENFYAEDLDPRPRELAPKSLPKIVKPVRGPNTLVKEYWVSYVITALVGIGLAVLFSLEGK